MNPRNMFCGRTRREFLWQAGGGFTSLGLVDMLSRDGFFSGPRPSDDPAAGPLAPKPPHHAPKAKACIFLFMYGGPSHVDTFDYKPKLYPLDGKTIDVQTKGRGGSKSKGRVVGPKWKFSQYGESGRWISDLFPHVGRYVDDMAFIHSMYADSPLHGSAMLMMNSGRILSGAPCLGSWVNYGLGTENQNLPGFVVMLDKTGGPISGAKNWHSGYMPAVYQGTVLRPTGEPILDLDVPNGMSDREQRRILDALREQNEAHLSHRSEDTTLAARIQSYELAYRMQSHAPEAIDIANESASTKTLYGLDDPRTEDFGRKCLLARRMVERGVRFVQVYSGGNHNDHNWDAHGDLEHNHSKHAGATDKPIAALLADLKQRGLLDETIVVWGGEFGRTPFREGRTAGGKVLGRDHFPDCYSMFMAGGGVKGGANHGQSDELGFSPAEDPVHVHDLQATILHLLGFDHERLIHRFQGRDYRLTDVHGKVIRGILS